MSEDVAFRERFRREGQIQAAIDHPNIVTVYEAGETGHGLFLAMRLVRGPNLKDMILSRELDAGRSLRILMPVGDALATAHTAGLIHRDIKPQNILVGGRDHPYLADFGLTKGPGEKSLTKTGQFVGTLDYISPEQIRGERATTRSDVYALGAVLYECLTGVVPYPKESEAAVLYAHMADPPPLVTEERPELPRALDDVLRRAMAKQPEERYASASEVLREAERAFGKRVRAAFAPPGPLEVPEETGVRAAEMDVPTREAPAPESREPAAPATAAAHVEATRPPAAPTEEAQRAAPADAEAPKTAVPGAPARAVAPAEAESREAAAPRAAAAVGATRPAAPEEETQRLAGTPATTPISSQEVERPDRAPPRAHRRPSPVTPARPRPGRRALSPRLLGIAGAILLLAGVGGFLAARSGSEEAAPAGTSFASAGALELALPDDWAPVPDRPKIPGMRFANRIAVAPRRGTGENALIAGQLAASGPTLLPSGFLDRLDRPPSREDAVRLGDLEAYRYANLRPKRFDRRLTLYVVPSTGGVATVACLADTARAAEFLPACERVASSLRLTSGESFPLGPDPGLAGALDKAIRPLNSARKTGLRGMRRARTRDGQASSAERIARAYELTARALKKVRVSPAARRAVSGILAALERTETGYRRLGTQARRGSRRGYDSGRRAVRRGETALRRALAGLEALGYELA